MTNDRVLMVRLASALAAAAVVWTVLVAAVFYGTRGLPGWMTWVAIGAVTIGVVAGVEAARTSVLEAARAAVVALALAAAVLVAFGFHEGDRKRGSVSDRGSAGTRPGVDSLEQLLQSFDGRVVDVTDGGEVVRGRLRAGADAFCVTLAPEGNESARCYAYAEVRSVRVEGSPSRAVVTVNDRPTLNQGR